MNAQMHRIHMPGVGEGVIYSGGGVPYEYDDELQYPLGAYVRFGNKGFVYASVAGGGITVLQQGVRNTAAQPVTWSTIAETVAAGVKQVTVDVSALEGVLLDDVAAGNVAKDELKGGEISLMPTWNTGFIRHITGNSLVTGGGEMTVDFDSPTPAILTENTAHAEIILSPYKGVFSTSWARTPVVGMPTLLVPTGKFCWLQVEGPFQPAAATDIGNLADRMEAVFHSDGTIGPHDPAQAGEQYQQHAGVIISWKRIGNAQGAPFIFLQIAH